MNALSKSPIRTGTLPLIARIVIGTLFATANLNTLFSKSS